MLFSIQKQIHQVQPDAHFREGRGGSITWAIHIQLKEESRNILNNSIPLFADTITKTDYISNQKKRKTKKKRSVYLRLKSEAANPKNVIK